MRGRAGRSGGFTLIELIVAAVVGTLLAAIAIPNMLAFISNNRAASQANEIVGTLALARSEAATRGLPVTACALVSANGSACAASQGAEAWENGWQVFIDNDRSGTLASAEQVLRIYPALQGNNMLRGAGVVTFLANGFLGTPPASLRLRLAKCHASSNRDILISATGRTSVAHVAC